MEVELDDEESILKSTTFESPDPSGDNISVQINRSVSEVDNAIRNYYTSGQRLYIERLSGLTVDLKHCYINLATVNHAEALQQDQAASSFSLEKRLRLVANSMEQHISLEKLFESRKIPDGKTIEPRRIFIQGRAGIGKTTLCKKIVHEFVEGRFGNGLFDRLLWVPLRRLKNTNVEDSWHGIIRAAFPLLPPKCQQSITTFVDCLHDPTFLNRTLLLFDGLDEISYEWKEDYRVDGFLPDILCNTPNIIVTSRPRTQNLNIGTFHLELETIGFLPEQVEMYLQQCVDNENTRSSMQNFIAKRPLLQGLLRIPIQLDAFCYTWRAREKSKQKMFDTMTTLYSSICIELWRKDLRRLDLWGKDVEQLNRNGNIQSLDDRKIAKLTAAEQDFLEGFAFQGLLNDIVEFTSYHQELIGSHLECEAERLKSPYKTVLERLSFLRTSSEDDDRTLRSYHFLHLTFQEYFATGYFVKCWFKNEQLSCLYINPSENRTIPVPVDEFIQRNKYDPRYNIFWRFVVGLIQGPNNELSDRSLDNLFQQFASVPCDLLGFVHIRLLMYAASELIPKRDVTKHLQVMLEQQLRSWAMTEHIVHEHGRDPRELSFYLASEMEFPQSLLHAFFEDPDPKLWLVALRVLSRRRYLPDSAVDLVVSVLKDNTTDLQLQEAAVDVLRRQSNLTEATISILIPLLRHKTEYLALTTGGVLMRQSQLTEEHADSILEYIIADPNRLIRIGREFLVKQASSSQKRFIDIVRNLTAQSTASYGMFVFEPLARAFRQLPVDDGIIALETILYLLSEVRDGFQQVFLERLVCMIQNSTVIDTITLFRSINSKSRSVVLEIFNRIKRNLPSEILNTWLTDPSAAVRFQTAEMLLKLNHAPTVDILATIGPALRDADASAREAAAKALQCCDLNDDLQKALVALLTDTVSDVRNAAAEALGQRHRGPDDSKVDLSKEVYTILNDLLIRSETEIRNAARDVLRWNCPYRDSTLTVFSGLLKSVDIEFRNFAIKCLQYSTNLPPDILEIVKVVMIEAKRDLRISSSEPMERLCWNAMKVLLSQNDPVVNILKLVTDWLDDPLPEVREKTVLALRFMQNLQTEISVILVKMLPIEDKDICKEICSVLQHWEGISQIAVEILLEWIASTNLLLRMFAIQILGSRSDAPREVLENCILAVNELDEQVSAIASKGLEAQLDHFLRRDRPPEGQFQWSDVCWELAVLESSLGSILLEFLNSEDCSKHDGATKTLVLFGAKRALSARLGLYRQQHKISEDWQIALKSLLRHKDVSVQKTAGKMLQVATNLQQDCIVAFCSWWSDMEEHVRNDERRGLGHHHQEAISMLGRQSILPSEARSYLLNLLVAPGWAYLGEISEAIRVCLQATDKRNIKVHTFAQVINQAAELNVKREFIRESIKKDFIADLLPLLNDEAWVMACIILITCARKSEISCYELKDTLCLRSNGRKDRIDFDTVQQKRFLRILADTRSDPASISLSVEADHVADQCVNSTGVVTEVTDDSTDPDARRDASEHLSNRADEQHENTTDIKLSRKRKR